MQNTLVKRLMASEAVTLAVASTIHLIGGSYDAGVAEGLICAALLVGLSTGNRAALGALYFAIFGFVVGLTSTVSGGETVGLVYHAVMLPILIVTLLAARSSSFRAGASRGLRSAFRRARALVPPSAADPPARQRNAQARRATDSAYSPRCQQ